MLDISYVIVSHEYDFLAQTTREIYGIHDGRISYHGDSNTLHSHYHKHAAARTPHHHRALHAETQRGPVVNSNVLMVDPRPVKAASTCSISQGRLSNLCQDKKGRHCPGVRAGKYIKKPYILEKIGIAVKEELEKQAVLTSFSMLDYLYDT